MSVTSIFDTHCHLADRELCNDIKKILEMAKQAGVDYVLNVGYNHASNQLVIKQSEQFPELLSANGLHPNDIREEKEKNFSSKNLQWMEEQILSGKVIAIGEIGLDYYRTYTRQNIQQIWFRKQLKLAKKYDLPVLLHVRRAFTDAYRIVRRIGNNKGVLHCFTGSYEIASRFIQLGFYISFAGNITYSEKNENNNYWKQVIESIPLDRIVVETDSPYLVPKLLRTAGSQNYPHNVVYVLEKIAEIKKIDFEKVKQQVYLNTLSLLQIQDF